MVAFTTDGVNNFNWISEPIRRYILIGAETIPQAQLRDERLTKHTLYWAVVEDSNFPAGENLRLNQIGRTQFFQILYLAMPIRAFIFYLLNSKPTLGIKRDRFSIF